MEISIILNGDSYNPRTKGEIKKRLLGLNFIQLGNGSSFTGFIVEDSSLEEIKNRLGELSNKNGVSIEEEK